VGLKNSEFLSLNSPTGCLEVFGIIDFHLLFCRYDSVLWLYTNTYWYT